MTTLDINNSILGEALNGKRGADQKRIAEAGLGFIELLLAKNNDYGSSVWKVPFLCPDMPVTSAILVRMSDKIERLAALQNKTPDVVDESFEDTIKDLGSYCLLYLSRPK